jgi:hypothetical protein
VQLHLLLQNCFQKHRRAQDIGGHVIGNFIHALTHTGAGSHMVDRINTVQGLHAVTQTQNRAQTAIRKLLQFGTELRCSPVNLGVKAVQDSDRMPLGHQSTCGVGADKACATGDQNIHDYSFTASTAGRAGPDAGGSALQNASHVLYRYGVADS